ncbi:transcription repressor OFP13-like [Phragmites australis]|uniref:transcription repressor OFP13-like n=1 Tax=Phragmites australis TaxID=29695 RepID=UPI002D784902|nr:transcription repressor OFP13-like [Phragmites australis]
MGRGLPFSSLFYTTNSAQDSPPPSPPPATVTTPPAWMWPSCKHPRTQSFRTPSAAAKTIASLFIDSAESSFANSSARTHHVDCASDSLSTESDEVSAAAAADDMADAIVRGLRSDRLLFEPRAPSSSILERKPPAHAHGEGKASSTFGGGVAVAFESADPYRDFRASMEEMMAAHGAGNWDWLEKMLAWYLSANCKDTHPAIVTAFVDLVVSMVSAGCASSSSRVSSFTLAGSEPAAESSSAGGHFSFGLR